MNTIVIFFAGVMTFISSLFGYTVQVPEKSPTAITEQASEEREVFTSGKKEDCGKSVSCEFCKNGNYAQWEPGVSDGGVTYYSPQGKVLGVSGKPWLDSDELKKVIAECEVVK